METRLAVAGQDLTKLEQASEASREAYEHVVRMADQGGQDCTPRITQLQEDLLDCELATRELASKSGELCSLHAETCKAFG